MSPSSKPVPQRGKKPAPRRTAGPTPSTPCLVCGKPVTRDDATLCLDCIQKAEKGKRPRFAGGARTIHGTRVARSVTCVRCGKEDYLAFKPKDPLKLMCRACTLEVVGLDEHGDVTLPAVVELTCQICGKPTKLPRRAAEKLLAPDNPEPVMCNDCDGGIVSRQGDKTLTGERRKSGVILKRKSS